MERIIIPLDGMKTELQMIEFVQKIQKAEMAAGEKIIWGFKVNDALVQYGVEIVGLIKKEGFRVFADPKLKDIPNTIHNSLNKLIEAGADIISVHCSADYEPQGNEEEKIAGITVLTSMNEESCQKIYDCSIEEAVNKFAILARDYYYGYCVCSARDIPFLPVMHDTKIICPGIRLMGNSKDDQVRIMTPNEAINAGAELLVVGRPILQANDPIQAINDINFEIQKAVILNKVNRRIS